MKRLSIPSAIVVSLLSMAALPAAAHHSFSMFDGEKRITLIGTVKEFQWTNPHVVIWVDVTDPATSRPVTWAVEHTSTGNLRRDGWTRETLKPGDKVEIIGNPLRDGAPGAGFVSLKIVETGKSFGIPNIFK
jgi:hypothetical protein